MHPCACTPRVTPCHPCLLFLLQVASSLFVQKLNLFCSTSRQKLDSLVVRVASLGEILADEEFSSLILQCVDLILYLSNIRVHRNSASTFM